MAQPEPNQPVRRRVWPQAALVSWLIAVVGIPGLILIRGNGESFVWRGVFIASILYTVLGGFMTQAMYSFFGTADRTTRGQRYLGALLTGSFLTTALYFLEKWTLPPSGASSAGLATSFGMGMMVGFTLTSLIVADVSRWMKQ